MALSHNVIETLPGYPGKLPFRLETGYIGIGESEEVQLFYYFIESERNPKDDPLIIWLTGGPGCSGLSNLIYQTGPFTIDYANSSGSLPALVYNPYSWTKVANIIYIDQPAGTGYSYAKTWEAYNTNDTLSAARTYEFLRKWLIYHPKYLNNPLYIGGESYSGLVVPLLVNNIYNAIEAGSQPPLNMKGYVQGNPATNKYWDTNERIPYAHRMGLLSDNLFKSVKESCKGNYVHADPNNVLCQRNLERVSEVANIIYIDQPAGTGYSYAKTWEAYNTNDTLSAARTCEFLRKWLIYHPKYFDNPLYIGGDSYSGLVVPLVVNNIYNAIEAGSQPPLNMKGYVQGNPLTNKYWDYNEKIPYAHRMGLLSDNLFKSVKESCKGNYVHADPNNVLCQRNLERVAECLDRIRTPHILEPWCSLMSKKRDLLSWDSSLEEETKDLLRSMNPFKRSWCRPDNYVYSYIWANDISVQKALHVSEGTIKEWLRCNMSMHIRPGKQHGCYVFDVQSTVEYHRNFTHKHCRALIFSGDHDMVVPHTGTEKWIDSLNLTVQSDWKPCLRIFCFFAGIHTEQYSHNDYQLTYATVKGAGHTAAEYNPVQCFAMVDRWFSELPL
ncbi:unnamed protein product [Fraxinus pennsylvanica]|uniref:Carboxypeptidase n=1 Tax=Fraxinus pennsylvanica TaxID=56036 RepID=A0AAD2ADY1_9LAMI|nr:unnamed protein product [Fraxinus pennsylvanica]